MLGKLTFPSQHSWLSAQSILPFTYFFCHVVKGIPAQSLPPTWGPVEMCAPKEARDRHISYISLTGMGPGLSPCMQLWRPVHRALPLRTGPLKGKHPHGDSVMLSSTLQGLRAARFATSRILPQRHQLQHAQDRARGPTPTSEINNGDRKENAWLKAVVHMSCKCSL